MTKKLLILSDLHVGSRVSVMPDEVYIDESERKMRLESNDIQKKIYRKWEEMCDSVGSVDAVINLGDTVDGTNRKSQGVGLWTTDIGLQIEVAKDLLGRIKSNRYFGVQGSYYHVGDNTSSDKSVIEGLGGIFSDELAIVADGKRIHASHDVGVSSSGFAYRTTPIAQQMMLSSLNNEYKNFSCILRGHAHYYVNVSFANSMGIICPCWKGRDEYVARKSLAYMPHLGYIVLTVGDSVVAEPHIFTLKGKEMMKEVVL